MGEKLRVYWNVPHQHKIEICSRDIRFVSQADFYAFYVFLVCVIGQPFFVCACVAAVAIGVGLRVANLALHLPDMDIVVPYFTALQILVTILTSRSLFEMITALQIFWSSRVHLFGFVAVNTRHIAPDGVNVPLAPFAQVFIANPAAVTSSALIEKVRTGLE
jgi:hypothetical protein